MGKTNKEIQKFQNMADRLNYRFIRDDDDMKYDTELDPSEFCQIIEIKNDESVAAALKKIKNNVADICKDWHVDAPGGKCNILFVEICSAPLTDILSLGKVLYVSNELFRTEKSEVCRVEKSKDTEEDLDEDPVVCRLGKPEISEDESLDLNIDHINIISHYVGGKASSYLTRKALWNYIKYTSKMKYQGIICYIPEIKSRVFLEEISSCISDIIVATNMKTATVAYEENTKGKKLDILDEMSTTLVMGKKDKKKKGKHKKAKGV